MCKQDVAKHFKLRFFIERENQVQKSYGQICKVSTKLILKNLICVTKTANLIKLFIDANFVLFKIAV